MGMNDYTIYALASSILPIVMSGIGAIFGIPELANIGLLIVAWAILFGLMCFVHRYKKIKGK